MTTLPTANAQVKELRAQALNQILVMRRIAGVVMGLRDGIRANKVIDGNGNNFHRAGQRANGYAVAIAREFERIMRSYDLTNDADLAVARLASLTNYMPVRYATISKLIQA